MPNRRLASPSEARLAEPALNERLYLSTETSTIVEPIEELSRVALTTDTDTAEGRLPCGSRGTVVLVHGVGEAYLVEFDEPFHTLIQVEKSGLEPIAGESRADLIAARDAGHRDA